MQTLSGGEARWQSRWHADAKIYLVFLREIQRGVIALARDALATMCGGESALAFICSYVSGHLADSDNHQSFALRPPPTYEGEHLCNGVFQWLCVFPLAQTKSKKTRRRIRRPHLFTHKPLSSFPSLNTIQVRNSIQIRFKTTLLIPEAICLDLAEHRQQQTLTLTIKMSLEWQMNPNKSILFFEKCKGLC